MELNLESRTVKSISSYLKGFSFNIAMDLNITTVNPENMQF